jgi:hypothetical protein
MTIFMTLTRRYPKAKQRQSQEAEDDNPGSIGVDDRKPATMDNPQVRPSFIPDLGLRGWPISEALMPMLTFRRFAA